jgi:hypothetical protein
MLCSALYVYELQIIIIILKKKFETFNLIQ